MTISQVRPEALSWPPGRSPRHQADALERRGAGGGAPPPGACPPGVVPSTRLTRLNVVAPVGGALLTDPVTAWLMVPDAPDLTTWFAELTRRPPWHASAACRGSGTDAFIIGRGAAAAAMAKARAICDRCTVTVQCLDYALADVDVVGVWGATTAQQRRQLRRDATNPGPEPGAVGR